MINEHADPKRQAYNYKIPPIKRTKRQICQIIEITAINKLMKFGTMRHNKSKMTDDEINERMKKSILSYMTLYC